jgi:hypothetical protein
MSINGMLDRRVPSALHVLGEGFRLIDRGAYGATNLLLSG